MAGAGSYETSSNRWYEIVQAYYPEALSRTHTVPPVHFNRVSYTLDMVPGTSQIALRQCPPNQQSYHQAATRNRLGRFFQAVRSAVGLRPPPSSPPQLLWPQESPRDQPGRVQESDLWDDAAQAHIVRNLEELGRHRQEVMFILSQFDLKDYLNKSAYHVAVSSLPLPSQLNNPGTKFSRGEFDVLIIHRRHGILIGEAKSVGHNHAYLRMTQALSDAAVVKKAKQALTQLARLETVVRHVTSDVTPHLTVRTALFLPNVRRAQLQRVVAADPQLEQDMCQRLTASNATQAVQLCCCADDVSDRATWWDVTSAVLANLARWWEGRMDAADPSMTDRVYLDIVARFVGPASTVNVYCCTSPRVEIRTEGEAVAELGWRLSRLVLTPGQWDLLNRRLPLVYLTGPPGTGKTVMLVVAGLSWLRENKDTYVISTSVSTLAISTMIVQQLTKTATSATSPTPTGRVQHQHYDLANDNSALAIALSELSAAAQKGTRFIMDEAVFDSCNDVGKRTHRLLDQLVAKVPGLHLWCAGIFRHAAPPPGLHVEVLTTPLRSAPAVLREVRPILGKNAAFLHNYADSNIPAPGDGQRVRRLRHEGGAHTGQWPVGCLQCGKNVAAELRRLGVGVPGSGVAYRDVFILTGSPELRDDAVDDVGAVTSPASGVVRGVRGEGMPVRVLGKREFLSDRARWEQDTQDVATATTDRITAADRMFVQGLERKVVVCLCCKGRDDGEEEDDRIRDDLLDVSDVLLIVTRCTTQLVVVNVPR